MRWDAHGFWRVDRREERNTAQKWRLFLNDIVLPGSLAVVTSSAQLHLLQHRATKQP
jgi:hypothetical protein